MKNRIKTVSRIFFKKNKKLIIIFFAIYTMLFLILNLFGFFGFRNHEFNVKNYIENEYVKYIEITSKKNGQQVEKLSRDSILELQKNADIKTGAAISYVLKNRFGLETDIAGTDNIFLTSYSGDIQERIFRSDIRKGEIFSLGQKIKEGNIELLIPIINDDHGNFVSEKRERYKIELKNTQYDKKLIKLLDMDSMYVISEDEMIGICSKMNIIPDIDKIILYVKDVGDIDHVATQLEAMQYNFNYALKYYEGMSEQILESRYLFIVMGLLLPILVGMILVFIFSIYIKSSVGDIAILLHIGYGKKDVSKLYMKKFDEFFLIGNFLNFLLLSISVFVGGSIFVSFVLFSIECFITLFLRVIMKRKVDSYSSKSPIDLIRKVKCME